LQDAGKMAKLLLLDQLFNKLDNKTQEKFKTDIEKVSIDNLNKKTKVKDFSRRSKYATFLRKQ